MILKKINEYRVEVKNKAYIAIPIPEITCEGCAFFVDNMTDYCDDVECNDKIWVEEEVYIEELIKELNKMQEYFKNLP